MFIDVTQYFSTMLILTGVSFVPVSSPLPPLVRSAKGVNSVAQRVCRSKSAQLGAHRAYPRSQPGGDL